MMTPRITLSALLLITVIVSSGCSEMFGTKSDSITDDIFDQGRQDPTLIIEEVGYAALLPFWTGFDQPTDVFVGYDEMVYVTDANGLHVLDRAGRRSRDVIPLRGAVAVVQDRLLNVYVVARKDTAISNAVTSSLQPENWSTGSGVPYLQSTGGWAETSIDSSKGFTFDARSNNSQVVTSLTFLARVSQNGPSAIAVRINNQVVFESNIIESSTLSFDIPLSINLQNEQSIEILGFDNSSRSTNGTGSFQIDDITLRNGGNVVVRYDFGGNSTSPSQVASGVSTSRVLLNNDITWDLPAVYKIRNANGAGPLQFVQTMVHPFMDASRAVSTTNLRFRLDRSRPDNDELVEITGVTVLANNRLLVSRRGPRNITGTGMAPDNTVLVYDDVLDTQGQRTGQMRNSTQIRNLNPNNATLLSAVGLTDIVSFVAPPQRENMTGSQSFLVSQGSQDISIPFRVLWVEAVETPDGLEYRSNGQLLTRDTTRADSFLYSEFRFENPTGMAFSADARGHIFVVDAAKDSLFLFQSNGYEGVNPPPGSTLTKAVNVSFGGTGSGPRQFNNPNGVAYFRQVVYVADTGNNRISRFKLNTDFE